MLGLGRRQGGGLSFSRSFLGRRGCDEIQNIIDRIRCGRGGSAASGRKRRMVAVDESGSASWARRPRYTAA